MNTKPIGGKKTNIFSQTNPLETDRKQSVAQKTKRAMSDIGGGVFDTLIGYDRGDSYGQEYPRQSEQPRQLPQRKEFTVFKHEVYHEAVNVKKEIEALTREIQQMVEAIKTQDSALLNEVKDAQRAIIESNPETPGVYHVGFLEVILKLLKSIREKISDSRTWLEAMTSKRAKRGSLFAVRAKKKGTQYSLSQELSNARSVQ